MSKWLNVPRIWVNRSTGKQFEATLVEITVNPGTEQARKKKAYRVEVKGEFHFFSIPFFEKRNDPLIHGI